MKLVGGDLRPAQCARVKPPGFRCLVVVDPMLRMGETVVTAGQIKLHNGSPVLIDNSITPTADAAPAVPLDR